MSSFIPHTIEPYSFAGKSWLFALNLWMMSAGAALMARLVLWQLKDGWRHRHVDVFGSPAFIFRTIGVLIGCGITLRCGAEAVKLWGWDPGDAQGTIWALRVKPYVDPFSLLLGFGGMALFALSLPGMMMLIRRTPPLPLKWPSRRNLKGPIILIVGTAIMACVLVVTRQPRQVRGPVNHHVAVEAVALVTDQ